jgi:hypothetical protein
MPTNNSWNSPACSFSAYKSATTANVTGNSTTYSYVCDAEISDFGSNYNNATGVFTAPVTGSYLIGTRVLIVGCTIATEIDVFLTFTTYTSKSYRKRAAYAGDLAIQLTQILPMTAGDTCYPSVVCIGEAADTDDVYGAAHGVTTFFGCYIGP